MPLNRKIVEEGTKREIDQNQFLMKRDLTSDEKHEIRKRHEQIAMKVDIRRNK